MFFFIVFNLFISFFLLFFGRFVRVEFPFFIYFLFFLNFFIFFNVNYCKCLFLSFLFVTNLANDPNIQ